MTKSIKMNSGNIIKMREDIDAKKKKYWKIIRTTNVLSKKEVANNFRTHDLKELYNEILQLAKKLVLVKGMLFYLNMGITKFDKEAFKKTNNYNIFEACELKEIIAQLKMVPTLNPKTKSQKGLKSMAKTEVFTSAKIAALIKDLELKANKFDTAMDKFNSETEIDITSLDDEFETDLAA